MKAIKKKEPKYFFFKGIKINNIDFTGLRALIHSILIEQRHAYFCLTDVGNLMMAQRDSNLASAINQATLSIADGMPLAWFGKLTGRQTIQRISGIDLFQQLIHQTDYKHLLLGDTNEMHVKVIAKAVKAKPNVKISGFSPPFKESFTEADNQIILKKIKNEQPDIIWVSFGGGKQEKWMLQNAAKIGRGIMIGVGAAFKYYIGDLIIPPQLIQKFGLQWITRLKKNPKRWMTKGQFKFRILFSLNFPFELIKAKSPNHPHT